MKRTIILSAMLLMVAACVDTANYRYHQTYMMINPVPSKSRVYEDSKVRFRFEISVKRIEVNARNLGEKSIVIIWHKARFVDSRGVVQRVANNENIFTRDMKRMSNQTILAGEDYKDIIVPVRYIVKEEEQWTWSVKPLYDQINKRSTLNRKKSFMLILPVMVDGEVRTYEFEFMVTSVNLYTPKVPS